MSVQGMMFNPYMFYGDGGYSTMGDLPGMEDFDGSIWGCPGMGMPFMGMGDYNYQQYYDNMMRNQEFYSDYSRHNIELQRNNDISINSPDVAINKAQKALLGKIVENEQEQIPMALVEFRNAVRKKYPNATEEQIGDYLAYEYSIRTDGHSITDDIRQYGSGSFVQGLKQGLGFGLIADNRTAAENCADIEGLPESRTSKMKKEAGRVTGGAVTGATVGGCIFGVPGAIVGGILGGLLGYFANKK